MKAQARIIEYENEEPNWFAENAKLGWRIFVGAVDEIWWFVMEAKVVRQVGPDEQPEVADRAERIYYERGLGPWL